MNYEHGGFGIATYEPAHPMTLHIDVVRWDRKSGSSWPVAIVFGSRSWVVCVSWVPRSMRMVHGRPARKLLSTD